MGSETTSLSQPKNHKNPRYDTDEDGKVDSVDFNGPMERESGYFVFGATQAETATVTLNNTYEPDTFIPSVGVIPGYASQSSGARVSSINTNANGKVDSFDITYGGEGNSNTVNWYAQGVKA